MRSPFFLFLFLLANSLFGQTVYEVKVPSWDTYAETIYNGYRDAHSLKCDTTALPTFDKMIIIDDDVWSPYQDEEGVIYEDSDGVSAYSSKIFSRKKYDRMVKKIENKIINKSDQLMGSEGNGSKNTIELKIGTRLEATERSMAFPFPIMVEDDCGHAITWFFTVMVDDVGIGEIDFLNSGIDKDYMSVMFFFDVKELKELLESSGVGF